MELREKLLLEVAKASVSKAGVDNNEGVASMHAKAIVKLVDEIMKEIEKK